MSASELTCPFCESADVELVSAWGGQLITSQMRCRTCNTHFEALRDDFDSDGDPGRAEAPQERLPHLRLA